MIVLPLGVVIVFICFAFFRTALTTFSAADLSSVIDGPAYLVAEKELFHA